MPPNVPPALFDLNEVFFLKLKFDQNFLHLRNSALGPAPISIPTTVE